MDMIVLAVDTASSLCAASIRVDRPAGPCARFSERRTIGRGHAEILFDVIHSALEQAALKQSDVDRIAVNVGPGSFTGLRTGVAAARGLALALACPCIGVTVPEALARAVPDRHSGAIAAIVDAGRGDVVLQFFDGMTRQPQSAPRTIAATDITTALAGFQGVAVGSGRTAICFGSGDANDLHLVDMDWPDIDVIADIGAEKEPAAAPRPFYSRAADAKPQQSANLVAP